MSKIIIFSSDFRFTNVQSFLLPFLKYKNFFYDNNIKFEFNDLNISKIGESEYIFLESKQAVIYSKKKNISLIDLIKKIKSKSNKLIFFDTSDSTEVELPEILPYVHKYCKAQILKNTKNYKKSYYGGRIFTDFVFKEYDIRDKHPRHSKILSQSDLKKLCIFWNSSINNFGFDRIITSLLYRTFKMKFFLKLPSSGFSPERSRKNFMSFNFNIKYPRESVAWYRKNILKLLHVESKKKNYLFYFKDLLNTKYVLSPFGWGEINYRDFEAFLSGSILIKPNMDHLDTWPNFYNRDKFYIDYKWDCSDLVGKIEDLQKNYKEYIRYADNAQKFYLETINNDNLKYKILERINIIMN